MGSPTLRMYVDENGNYSLREAIEKDGNRFLCLTGVVMRLQTHELLTQQFNELKQTFLGSADVVLHRREIISAAKPFDALRDPMVRSNYDAALLKLIKELRFGIISVVIDKKALVDKYGILQAQDPYALGLEYLMQRYQYWMQDYSSRYGHAMGDILAEARGGKEDKTTKEAYRLIFSGQGYNGLQNADHFFSSKEIKLKKKKENIAGLQLVDLLSHPARRYILSSNGLAKDLKQTSFEQRVVDILVNGKFRRHNGTINGAGAVLFPK